MSKISFLQIIHFCQKKISGRIFFCWIFLSWKHFLAVNFFLEIFLFRIFCCYFFLVEHFCQQNCCCGIFVTVRICSRWSQEPTFKVWSKLGLWQLRYSWYGQMSQGQMLPEQMSFWKLKYVQIGPRNLPLKFGQNRTSNSWDIVDMDKCRQDKCCMDKCPFDYCLRLPRVNG